MVPRRLFVADTVFAAFADTWQALRAMPVLTGCAALVILAIAAGQELLPRELWDVNVSGTLLDFAVDAVRDFCLAPFMIAISRFVILSEKARGYVVDPNTRLWRFAGWLIALSVLVSVAFMPALADRAGAASLVPLVVFVVALVAVIVLALRLSILFPALAVDAKRAGAANAMADTRGYLFKIFLVFALALLPLAVAAIVVTFLLGPRVGVPGSPTAIAHLVAGAIIQTVMILLCVAAASRLYQAIGNRLGPPA
jgi:hypothetical protein